MAFVRFLGYKNLHFIKSLKYFFVIIFEIDKCTQVSMKCELRLLIRLSSKYMII